MSNMAAINATNDFFNLNVQQVQSYIPSITSYSDVIELIKMLPYNISNKLQLLPDDSITGKLNHLYNVLTIAITSEETCVGVEGSSIFGTQTDFDLLMISGENKLSAVDATVDRSLHTIKLDQMRVKAKILTEELKALGHNYTVEPKVLFIDRTFTTPIEMPVDRRSRFDLAYDIVDSVVLDEYTITKAKQFLDDYDDKLAATETFEVDENMVISAENIAKIVKMAQFNNINSIRAFNALDIENISFLDKCKQTASKLSSYFLRNKISTNYANYNIPVTKDEATRDILDSTAILRALTIIKSLDDGKYHVIKNDFTHEESFDMSELFITGDTILSAKYLGNDEFKIFFNVNTIDENLKESIIRSNTKIANKTAPNKILDDEFYLRDAEPLGDITAPEEFIAEQKTRVKVSYMNNAKGTVCDKLVDICNHNSTTLKMGLDFTVSKAIASLVESIANTATGVIMDLEYSIAKAFCTTLHRGNKLNTYKLADVAGYNCKVLFQANSNIENFTNSFYVVFYESTQLLSVRDIRAPFRISEGKYVQCKSLAFNRNTLSWTLRKIYSVIMFTSWLTENKNINGVISTIHDHLIEAYYIHGINRDSFATASEQVRYLYVSTTGRCSKPSKILSKLDTYHPRRIYELVYLIRMVKMASALYLLKTSSNLLRIRPAQDKTVLTVAFPHETTFHPDFNYTISSFYICNVFNKFKYNQEISEVLCFEGLLEEEEIYRQRLTNNQNEVLGVSQYCWLYNETSFIKLITEDRDTELNHAINVSKTSPTRFSFSIVLILCIFIVNMNRNKKYSRDLAKKLTKSPIDACTLRGGMSGNKVTSNNQGVRAATTILEGVIKAYGHDVDVFNRGTLEQQTIYNDLITKDVSLSTLTAINYNNSDDYAYRIVHKDQKGQREISVLNYPMRIGAKVIEEAARVISREYPSNVLENSQKDIVMQTEIRKSKTMNTSDSICVYDNNDQQRWGPNHLTVTFYAMLKVHYSDDIGLCNIMRSILKRFETKKAKYPESVLEMIEKDKQFRVETTIGAFIEKIKPNIAAGIYHETFEWGMLQGILHMTSSVYHSIISLHVEKYLVKKQYVREMRTLITSDDGFRVMKVPTDSEFNVPTILAKINSSITRICAAANIIRSPSKSTFNSIVAEFNSNFYVDGKLFVPSLKQRISKIDCGSGEDYIDDICAALSMSVQYFTAGGTYFGTFVSQILNVCQVTEQWRRWFQYSKEGSKMATSSVFTGGLPLISPLTTLIAGPIGNIFVKDVLNGTITSDEIAHYFSLVVSAEDELVKQAEIIRGNSIRIIDEDFTYMKTVSIAGFINLTRPSLHASRLSKRHKLNKILFKPDEITLEGSLNSFNNLLFNIATSTASKDFEEILGTNNYATRYSEAYINLDNPRFKIHRVNCFSSKLGKVGDRISLRDLENYYELNSNDMAMRAKIRQFVLDDVAPSTQIIKSITSIIELACKIHTEVQSRTLRQLPDEKDPHFVISKTVRNQISILDEESFRYSAFKSIYKGDSFKIFNKMGISSETFNHLYPINLSKTDDLVTAIIATRRTTDVFQKYLKYKTKGIIKTIEYHKDTVKMMTNACFLNFTSNVKLLPPNVKVSRPGAIIRLCRDVANTKLMNSLDEFALERSAQIFLTGKCDKSMTYYCDTQGLGLGNFELMRSNYSITDNANDSKMVITRGDTNKVRKRIDTLLPTNTPFNLSTFIINNINFEKLSISGWVNFDNTFIRTSSIDSCPFTVDNCGLLSYTIEQKGNSYSHKLLVNSSTITPVGTVSVRVKQNVDIGYVNKIRSVMGSYFRLNEGLPRRLTATDSILIKVIDSTTDLKLEYSTSSMIVVLSAGSFKLPYAVLPMKEIEPLENQTPVDLNIDDFSNIRKAMNELFTTSLDDKIIADKIIELLNNLEIPCSDADFSVVVDSLIEILEESFAPKLLKKMKISMEDNKDYVLMMLIFNFVYFYKSTPLIDRTIRSHNFSKSKQQRMFSTKIAHRIAINNDPVIDSTEVIEEQTRAQPASMTAGLNLFSMGFDLADDEDDIPVLGLGELLSGAPQLMNVATSTTMTAQAAPSILSSLNMLDIFSIEEDLGVDPEVAPDDDEPAISITTKVSADDDTMYVINAKNLINKILLESNALITTRVRSEELVNLIATGRVTHQTLSTIIKIMSKYVSLERIALILIMFKRDL